MTQNNVGIYASQISGHLWAPNGAMDALATVTVGSTSVASVTFSGIPQGYKHLQIRATVLGTSSSIQDCYWRYNGDSGNNYSIRYMLGNGGGSGAVYTSGGGNVSAIRTNSIVMGTSYPNIAGPSIIDILDYGSSTKNKTSRHLSGLEVNSPTGPSQTILDSGCWYSASPITSINLYPGSGNFAQYTQFALYGVK